VKYRRSRNYGFSATFDKRLDGKDMRGEGAFGPIVQTMNYQEAKEHKLVVPIVVKWRKVWGSSKPCEGARDSVELNRIGVWTNDVRNDMIAEDARRYGDEQVLVICKTIEHAVNLKKRLPEFTLVYSEGSLDAKRRKRYVDYGLIAEDEPEMTTARRKELTEAFERGDLRHVICTTVWNVGVSFNHLKRLIRADAGGSEISDTQIPGRVSRSADGKTSGTVHDYMDMFSANLHGKSLGRRKSYERNGWAQKNTD